MNRLQDVEEMTLSEFHYKRYAQEYKEIDEEYRLHKSAFLIRNAAATKTVGTGKNQKEEYVFKDFHDFFNYEKALQVVDMEITEEPVQNNKKLSPAQIALQHNQSRG
ncbi:hypothetical protein [Halobacillus massiliensis]|uniref:hypothetical protein n=1 Tax=Halobacillus massiliensis TaxID=1926286 RepID=UPI00117AA8A2|nr:hypothetical protein [Halobacillus massiliensis]